METYKAIAAVIKNACGLVLVQDHVKIAAWTIPCGKIDGDEEPITALVRELKEETCLEVMSSHLLIAEQVTMVYCGKEVNVLQYIYEVSVKDLDALRNAEPQKHRQLRFVTIDALRKLPVSVATKMYLDYVNDSETVTN